MNSIPSQHNHQQTCRVTSLHQLSNAFLVVLLVSTLPFLCEATITTYSYAGLSCREKHWTVSNVIIQCYSSSPNPNFSYVKHYSSNNDKVTCKPGDTMSITGDLYIKKSTPATYSVEIDVCTHRSASWWNKWLLCFSQEIFPSSDPDASNQAYGKNYVSNNNNEAQEMQDENVNDVQGEEAGDQTQQWNQQQQQETTSTETVSESPKYLNVCQNATLQSTQKQSSSSSNK